VRSWGVADGTGQSRPLHVLFALPLPPQSFDGVFGAADGAGERGRVLLEFDYRSIRGSMID